MKKNINELIAKSEQKDKFAMEELALCYLRGINGASANPTQAYKLFKESAELGNLNSLFNIAKIHLVESYGIKDIPKGINLLKKAAKSKHAESCFELGKIYYYGKGQDVNIEEAEKYLRDAANSKKPNPKSQYLLAYIWENGLLDNYINIEESFKYYEKSAKLGFTDSLFKCGLFYLNGIEDYLDIDINKSIEYLRKSSGGGHFESSSLLAKVYLEESRRLLTGAAKKSEDAKVVLNILSKIDLDMLK